MLPLYDTSAADWSTACSGLAGTHSFVVADIGNPGGPGTAENPGWASNIADCGNAHVGVLGYVDTGYCQVPLATVESQVDQWYSWYGTDGLSGIFFDEAANPSNPSAGSDCLSRTTSAISYYQSIAAYAHGKAAGQTVTFNFGVNPASSWPLSSSNTALNADIIVIFEDTYGEYVDYGGSGAPWSPSAWEAGFGAQHFSILAYDAAGAGQPAAFCATVSGQNIGNVYVTPSLGLGEPAPRGVSQHRACRLLSLPIPNRGGRTVRAGCGPGSPATGFTGAAVGPRNGASLTVLAFRAPAEDGCVMGVDGEPEVPLGLPGQFVEQVVPRLDALSALGTDQMAVGVGRQLVGHRTVAEMGVAHDAELLQLLEVPVDGGRVDVG